MVQLDAKRTLEWLLNHFEQYLVLSAWYDSDSKHAADTVNMCTNGAKVCINNQKSTKRNQNVLKLPQMKIYVPLS